MPSGWDTQLAKARGEHLVCAELCKRGYLATPFAGNVPYIDILAASKEGRLIAVQVKSATLGRWQFSMNSFVEVDFGSDGCQALGSEKPDPYPGLAVVLVWLADPQTRFFVASWKDFRDRHIQLLREYVSGLPRCETHIGYFRRHKPSPHMLWTMKEVPEGWEGNWPAILDA